MSPLAGLGMFVDAVARKMSCLRHCLNNGELDGSSCRSRVRWLRIITEGTHSTAFPLFENKQVLGVDYPSRLIQFQPAFSGCGTNSKQEAAIIPPRHGPRPIQDRSIFQTAECPAIVPAVLAHAVEQKPTIIGGAIVKRLPAHWIRQWLG